ncbi:uncharacterized protein EV154DRAFT_529514 [Mucor mucedo]|uniref:uncharacterized protein n=1 Tax=Mucor mucedo TaxID=29922 RepID=UPI0022210587|nr:uncharacterized protein EV154DRAFT_529514 [Mucor mucedo]KAI7871961.1 hypothetical protein EV154DRAFT_529514 [Mucor mucedo]
MTDRCRVRCTKLIIIIKGIFFWVSLVSLLFFFLLILSAFSFFLLLLLYYLFTIIVVGFFSTSHCPVITLKRLRITKRQLGILLEIHL